MNNNLGTAISLSKAWWNPLSRDTKKELALKHLVNGDIDKRKSGDLMSGEILMIWSIEVTFVDTIENSADEFINNEYPDYMAKDSLKTACIDFAKSNRVRDYWYSIFTNEI